jgi:hypothetical protein
MVKTDLYSAVRYRMIYNWVMHRQYLRNLSLGGQTGVYSLYTTTSRQEGVPVRGGRALLNDGDAKGI